MTKELIPYHAQTTNLHQVLFSFVVLGAWERGPLDPVVKEIAKAKDKTEGQDLLKWDERKADIVVTSCAKPERLRKLLAAEGSQLTEEEVGAYVRWVRRSLGSIGLLS